MGLFKEALFAFRGRRFVEWFFMNRPQLPLICGITFYTFLYLHYKYDLIARWKGQPTFNDYSYVKQAAERERTRLAALSSSPTSTIPPSQSSPSSTGVN
ncbi:unnamed protein product [Rotaria sordida]|uniref:Uncharacterized protein n=1 Tax=Rotaria sordida TaxID=392033 RepID=A0A814G2W7_9BILA|nr:unnamed protein product [Rotaria sordida]CAF0883634.1 unnamed protein product [Rotaria sordida]CAF0988363.1 unnamed protein product [Rotaria sordida]CAF3635149.1 unnamed protein product [Rotaria sordida]CAF3719299.1 unnamed protein product [Rotaria sordida]